MLRYHLEGIGWAFTIIALALTDHHSTAALAAVVLYQHAKEGPQP